MAADDNPWGTGARVQRPQLGNQPSAPRQDPSTKRMAEIAYEASRGAEKRAIEPYKVQEAAGTLPKPRARVGADGKYTIEGITQTTFFGPSQPIRPVAQDPDQGAVGRRLDYPVGYNLLYTPRGTEAIGFSQLRALADNLDVLRLGLETRKDQAEALEHKFRLKDDKKNGEDHPDVKLVTEFFEYPDKEHGYSEWMRAVLEDLLVIDAPCLYPRYTNGGELYSLDLMDGGLIVPRVDATGRRPMPPDPAYQQILKGLPAVDYSSEELIYRPRNVRTNKIYGYSPVEQIIMTVNIALRRQLFQLSYYTDGSIPDALGMVPETWTPAMIAEYQLHWDTLFENPTGANAAMRRKMKWIPGAKDIKFSKDAILKDEFDEWLARIVCYCLSLEPTPFIKQMNRATAETQREQSRAEGLLPLKKYWKALMNFIIAVHLKKPNVVFAWQDEEANSPLDVAKVNDIKVRAGAMTIDEWREGDALAPLPDGMGSKPLIYTGAGAQRLEDVVKDPPEPVDGAPGTPGAPPAAGGGAAAQPGKPGAGGAAASAGAGDKGKPDAEAAAVAAKVAGQFIHSLGKAGAVHKFRLDPPKIIYADVPLLAGMSEDGATCYLDKRLQDLVFDLPGGKVRPAEVMPVHKLVENLLVKNAQNPYAAASTKATGAVGLFLHAQGFDPEEYERALAPIAKAAADAARAGAMLEVPADLARYAYDGANAELLGDDAPGLGKAHKGQGRGINRNRTAVRIQRERMTRIIKRAFRAQAKTTAGYLAEHLPTVKKMKEKDDLHKDRSPEDILGELINADYDKAVWNDWPELISDPLERVSRDAATTSTELLPAGVRTGAGIGADFANEYAISYAAERGAEMVGKRLVNGELVDNPDARWVITDETRDGVKRLGVQALEEGWSNDRLADELSQAYAFSAERAEKIARTETAFADSQGNLAGWKETGVVQKKVWLTAEDDLVSPECAANGDQGPIDIDDDFKSGDDAPPVHPNCRCAIAPVIEDDEAEKVRIYTKLQKRKQEAGLAGAVLVLAQAVAGAPPAQVTVNVPKQEATVVNVAPAAVTVAPAQIHVASPNVNVKVDRGGGMVKFQTDDKGEITGAQLE